jgi:hypothetical protein
MKLTTHFFLKKSDPKAAEGMPLGGPSAVFPYYQVAVDATKKTAESVGADEFELEADDGSLKTERWERDGSDWKKKDA